MWLKYMCVCARVCVCICGPVHNRTDLHGLFRVEKSVSKYDGAACAGLSLLTSSMCTDLLYHVIDTEEWAH